MSKLGATALVAALGYLMFRVIVGACMLLYYIVKMAILIPIALFALGTGQASVKVSRTDPTAKPKPARAVPVKPTPTAAPAADLGPASIDTTGDWRQDRETLIRLLNEGKIK